MTVIIREIILKCFFLCAHGVGSFSLSRVAVQQLRYAANHTRIQMSGVGRQTTADEKLKPDRRFIFQH
jgi:hypothetical protein